MDAKPEPRKLLDYMIDIRSPADLPHKVYWVNTYDPSPFRRPGWIIAPENTYRLTADSTTDFIASVRNHWFRAGNTPWVTIFKDIEDAETYGVECGCDFEISEVDTMDWNGKGVVVVNPRDVERVGMEKLESELLVHKGWEMDEGLAARFPPPRLPIIGLGEGVKKRSRGREKPVMAKPKELSKKSKLAELVSMGEEDKGECWKVRGILVDEMRYFYNQGEREWRRGYLVDWHPTNGIPWKPSWNKKADIKKDDLTNYLAKKASWKEPKEEGVIKAKLTFKDILYDEVVTLEMGGTATKARYLVEWEEDIAPTWQYEDEVQQKGIREFEKKSRGWQVWGGLRT